MKLACCIINHRSSTLEERERFQLLRNELSTATSEFKRITGCSEVLVLATCNRVEFYIAGPKKIDVRAYVKDFYEERGIEVDGDFERFWFIRQGTSVARHLFKVVCGLDSVLLGEYQVAGQVKDAYSAACSVSGPGKILHKLFHYSFQISKHVRTVTQIGEGSQGLAGAAFELVQKAITSSNKKVNVVLIGVNHLTENLISRFAKVDCSVTIVNRTIYNAEKIARSNGVRIVSLEELPDVLKTVDLLFSMTSARGCLLELSDLAERPNGRPLIMVDLAIPRDINPDVADLPYVTLYDLDDIKRYLNDKTREKVANIPATDELIESQVSLFESWRKSVNKIDNTMLRKSLDSDRREILQKFSDCFKEGEQKALDAFSKNLLKQFLRRITSQSVADKVKEDL